MNDTLKAEFIVHFGLTGSSTACKQPGTIVTTNSSHVNCAACRKILGMSGGYVPAGKLGTEKMCRAEEKRIIGMAGVLDAKLNGLQDLDTLSMKEVKALLETAQLLAAAVLHKDTEIHVSDA